MVGRSKILLQNKTLWQLLIHPYLFTEMNFALCVIVLRSRQYFKRFSVYAWKGFVRKVSWLSGGLFPTLAGGIEKQP
jgi:hypothetical protein